MKTLTQVLEEHGVTVTPELQADLAASVRAFVEALLQGEQKPTGAPRHPQTIHTRPTARQEPTP